MARQEAVQDCLCCISAIGDHSVPWIGNLLSFPLGPPLYTLSDLASFFADSILSDFWNYCGSIFWKFSTISNVWIFSKSIYFWLFLTVFGFYAHCTLSDLPSSFSSTFLWIFKLLMVEISNLIDFWPILIELNNFWLSVLLSLYFALCLFISSFKSA